MSENEQADRERRLALVGRRSRNISPSRFFPIEPDPELGWRLNFWDAATHKTLALVGRQTMRDYLEGCFTTPVRNGRGLARWMYSFCPDIVDQGVGTVDKLAKELEQGRLYFWWD